MVHPLCSLVVVGVGEKAVGRLAYLTVACRLVSLQLPGNRPGMGLSMVASRSDVL